MIFNDEAVALALDLEAAGHGLSVHEGRLMVAQGRKLSDDQRAAIRRHLIQLIVIATYKAPEVL